MTNGIIAQGSEFQVNSYTTSYQNRSSITALADGGYVITWMSNGQDGSDRGIYSQRYDATGATVGAEIQVNSFTAGAQDYPVITGLADGGYVIAWQSDGQDGNSDGVFAQRYDSSGATVGAEFQVNSYAVGQQYQPAITDLADGGFVITWQANDAQDGDGAGIFGQRYDASGTAVGAEFQINSYTTLGQALPSVTSLSDGGFVVTWTSNGQDGSNYGIFGQRYDASGVIVGVEFQVNTYTPNFQYDPAITALADGGFVVTWASGNQDGSSYGIYGQRFDASGAVVGAEFQVNTYTSGAQTIPTIAGLPDGGFVVAWMSNGQDGFNYGIYGQRYDADGVAVGAEVQINTYTNSYQYLPEITVLVDGSFVVSWSSNGQDGDSYGVYAQQFKAQLFGTSNHDTLSDTVGADWMHGQAGDDVLYGLDGDDKILGGAGRDLLVGGIGDDVLLGGGHRDELIGGDGNDRLKGGNGADILRGGADADIMFGGAGADQFIFSTLTDSDIGGGGLDKIRDFEIGVDKIDLSGFEAVFVGTAGFSGTGAEVGIHLNGGGGTTVNVDIDGDGSADMRFYLTDVTGVTVDDFWL